VIVVRPEPASAKESGAQAANPRDRPSEGAANKRKIRRRPTKSKTRRSYLDAMRPRLQEPDGGELISMKIQGARRRTWKEVRKQGLQPTPDELVGMRCRGSRRNTFARCES